jgi:hypothetical protein
VQHGVTEWEAMQLRRRVGGEKKVTTDSAQFVSIFITEVIWVLDYFSGFPGVWMFGSLENGSLCSKYRKEPDHI